MPVFGRRLRRENALLRSIVAKCVAVAPEPALPWNGEIGRFGAVDLSADEAAMIIECANAVNP